MLPVIGPEQLEDVCQLNRSRGIRKWVRLDHWLEGRWRGPQPLFTWRPKASWRILSRSHNMVRRGTMPIWVTKMRYIDAKAIVVHPLAFRIIRNIMALGGQRSPYKFPNWGNFALSEALRFFPAHVLTRQGPVSPWPTLMASPSIF
jgi:hypothetical protein